MIFYQNRLTFSANACPWSFIGDINAYACPWSFIGRLRHSSNHQPLIFSQELSSRQHALPFKIFKVWLKFGPNLLWDAPCLVCLRRKLKRFKHALKSGIKVPL
ncbi:hypothetical protein P8452_56266 [Trifolium repens]|jgi:hypothetical protein|nr:hypothetical protein P8452_56266 [Trifolium repens]